MDAAIHLFNEEFIKLLEESSDRINVSKVLSISIQNYSRILDLFKQLPEHEVDTFQERILFSLHYKAIQLMKDGEYKIPLKWLNQMDYIIMTLPNSNSHYHYLNLTIKHIYCLLHENLISDADFRCNGLSNYYKNYFAKNLHNIKGKIQKLNTLSYELIQVRSIIKFIISVTDKNNLRKIQQKYYFLSKEFEMMILRTGVIDNGVSDYPQFAPKISYPNDLVEVIKFYPQISNSKGSKKLKLWIKIQFLKFINFIDNGFWGYGFSLIKIIRSSIFVIIFYSCLMQFGCIQVIDTVKKIPVKEFFNYLYFSIVTFSSLGYGDIIPKSVGFSRILIASEAIVGIIFISLIIFVISKKRY
ncbi:MAG: potassium channel family protein [Candidatus Cloacimonadales bacterium]|nr:potassium channel family protein [Candidatus Cloacimonadales bacterium]